MRLPVAILLVSVLPAVYAQDGPKRSFEVTHTERVPFAAGGTIRLNSSYGYLTVEGWDSPEVEITVTKSTDRFFDPSRQAEVEKRLDTIRVVNERRPDGDLAITTIAPHPKSLLRSIPVTRPLMPNTRRGVTVEYKIRVPRESRLVVRHDNGYVWVSDVTGDIDVRSHTGDMIVMLPDPGPYSIDARTKFGNVTSDFTGKLRNRLLTGWRYAYAGQPQAKNVTLRMGRGCIAIKKGDPVLSQ